jgi:preprotein translocase subunit YajC
LTQILFFAVLIGAFYLLIIRPQQQQKAKHAKMMSELRSGRRVVTIGGVHGEIVGVDDEDIRVEVADGVVLVFSRAAVARFEDDVEAAQSDAESDASDQPSLPNDVDDASDEGSEASGDRAEAADEPLESASTSGARGDKEPS